MPSLIRNAATVDISGLELELQAQPWDGGFFSLVVGRLDSERREYEAFDPDAGGNIDWCRHGGKARYLLGGAGFFPDAPQRREQSISHAGKIRKVAPLG